MLGQLADLFEKGLGLKADKDPTYYASVYANAGRSHLEIRNYSKVQYYLTQAIQLNSELPFLVYKRLAKATAGLQGNNG